MSFTIDDATAFYFEQKQEVYTVGSDLSELEDELISREFTQKDRDRLNKIIKRGKEILEEIRGIEDLVEEYADEEMNPENVSYKGLKEELRIAMVPGKYMMEKYASIENYNDVPGYMNSDEDEGPDEE